MPCQGGGTTPQILCGKKCGKMLGVEILENSFKIFFEHAIEVSEKLSHAGRTTASRNRSKHKFLVMHLFLWGMHFRLLWEGRCRMCRANTRHAMRCTGLETPSKDGNTFLPPSLVRNTIQRWEHFLNAIQRWKHFVKAVKAANPLYWNQTATQRDLLSRFRVTFGWRKGAVQECWKDGGRRDSHSQKLTNVNSAPIENEKVNPGPSFGWRKLCGTKMGDALRVGRPLTIFVPGWTAEAEIR